MLLLDAEPAAEALTFLLTMIVMTVIGFIAGWGGSWMRDFELKWQENWKEMSAKLADFDRRHPNPGREFAESCMPGKTKGSDYDKDDTKIYKTGWGEAQGLIDTLSCIIRGNLYYGPVKRQEFTGEGNDYWWRLEVGPGKVELPRRQDRTELSYEEIAWNLRDTPWRITDPKVPVKGCDPIFPNSVVIRSTGYHFEVATWQDDATIAVSSAINDAITQLKDGKYIANAKLISDGWHTFQELYDMRLALTVAAFRNLKAASFLTWDHLHRDDEGWLNPVFRSRQHSDGTMFEGMFIVGLIWPQTCEKYSISFHYHDEHWDKFDFALTLDKAPEWDGHTDSDVMKRLLKL